MQMIKVNGAELAYDDAGGPGSAVVLLHAGIADRRMWHPVASRLAAAGHRVICPDLRGYGDSTLPAIPFAHHDDVVGLLDALGIARATLVGCSVGGATAIDAALAHPDRIAGLALIGSSLSGHEWSDEAEELWEATVGAIDEGDFEAIAEAEVRFWVIGPGRRADDLDPALLRAVRDMDRSALAAELSMSAVEVIELDPPAVGRLAEITVPTVVLAGAYDIPDIRRLADHLADGIAHAVRVPDVPGAAHLLPLERPDPVVRAVRDLLARQESDLLARQTGGR